MLSDFVEGFTALVEDLVLTVGAPGILIVALMENIFPPTPSEFLYPLAGKLAYDGEIGLLTVMLAGAFGSMLGAIIFYHVGYYLGADRSRRAIERWGTLRMGRLTITLFTVEGYDRAMAAFERRGGIIVAVARSVPLIHGVISIPAGVVGMNRFKFMFYTFIGVLAWITPTVLLGYALGSRWEDALALLDAYETLWYVLMAAGVLYIIYRRWRGRASEPSIKPGSAEPVERHIP